MTNIPALGVRHVQIFFMFSLLVIATGMRVQMSLAVVAMTEYSTSPNPNVPVYNWTNKNIVLSSFYWGYVVFQILAGNLGRLYGLKNFLLGSMIVNATACCLIPFMSDKLGSYGAMVCVFIEGLAQGFYFPSIHIVFSKWAPINERGTLCTLAFSGTPTGYIIGLPVVGFISSSWYGWPASFYLYAVVGYIWIVAYYLFGASTPTTSRYISDKEKKYIENNLNQPSCNASIPWKSIFTNIPLWAVIINQIGHSACYATLMSEIPTYMNKILKFDLKSNSLLSAAPYLASLIVTIIIGNLVDRLVNKNVLSVLTARKLSTAIGGIIPGIALLILGFLGDGAIFTSVIMFVLTIGIQSVSSVGASINHIDLAPNYAGVLLGIINSLANFVAIFGPTAVHLVVLDETDKIQWRSIFLMGSALYIIPAIIYQFFASTEVQAFNSNRKDTERENTIV